MFEEREAGAEEETIWLTADVAIRQSVSGKCYMQRWGLLYSPEDAVPGTVCMGNRDSSARQFVAACLIEVFGDEVANWPALARDFVDQQSQD